MDQFSRVIIPGSTVGILGGGQLGRMFAIAARRMGYRVHTYEPAPDSPAGQVSDVEVSADYTDLQAVRQFALGVDVISFEFENIPLATVEAAAELCPVRPGGQILHICQNREREKIFLRSHGFPCTAFRVVSGVEELGEAFAELGPRAVLKTADFGYDGKGQTKMGPEDLPADVWAALGAPRGVLEAWVPFIAELSVVVSRDLAGACRTFPIAENIHTNHILDLSVAPGRFPPEVHREAAELAVAVAEALDVCGLVAVEMFLTAEGHLIVNELAPRPHNSGHFSFDACVTSQFEQQLRAICGLPLGATDLLCPAVMWNILGDAWTHGEPNWAAALAHPAAKLHLYGKASARPGRKMGHITVLAPPEEGLAIIRTIQASLHNGTANGR